LALASGPVRTRRFHKRRLGVETNGGRFEAELAARGLEGQELARLAGLHYETIRRARSGKRITCESLEKIVAAFAKAPVIHPVALRILKDATTPLTKIPPTVREDEGAA
jgi:hypothetical protein